MKKLLPVLLILTAFSVKAQTKDATNKDSIIALQVPIDVINELANDIHIQASGKADVKPEVWKQLLQLIIQSSVAVPYKNEQKK